MLAKQRKKKKEKIERNGFYENMVDNRGILFLLV